MNNKEIIFLLVFAVFLFASCNERHSKAIDLAYQLSDARPDSSLSILDGVNQSKLSKPEMATIYNISDKGIRQRLFLYKSKVEIDGESISLRTFIEGF